MTRVRQPVLKGHRQIAGFWFSRDHLLEAELRAQVLAAWQSRSELFRFVDGYLLRFPQPILMSCEQASGWPLQRLGKTLISAELDETEHTVRWDADLLLFIGGATEKYRISDAKEIDAASWIEITEYTFIDTYPLEIASTPKIVNAEPAKTVRAVFGDRIAAPSKEREQFLARVTANTVEKKGKEGVNVVKQGANSALQRLLMTMLFPLALFMRSSSQSAGANGAVQARKSGPIQPQSWRKWLTNFAMMTQAARFIGWRQAAYLRRMMEKFDDGDLNEALRHAIPLGGDAGSLGQAFGTPGPRRDLQIRADRSATSSIGFGDEMEHHLRQLYRQAFARLDREGRVEEAAFVLAELLQVKQEALDYLVKHQRYQQASELALAWDMPADTIVRLCCLNNEWERAVLVARRDNAFATAVMMLQKQQPQLADQLRLEWAQALIQRGEWLAAVDAVWQIKESRESAAEWLLAAEKAGGVLGARALVQQALRLPDTLDRHRDDIQTLIDDPSRFRERWELAMALLSFTERNAAVCELATALLPMLTVDRFYARNPLTRSQYDKLLKCSSDALLKSDVPDFSPPPLPVKPSLLEIRTPESWLAPEPGLQPISDAIGLSGRRFLLAHGEAGLSVVDETGAAIHRYAIACHRIVLADSEQVALALAKRDEVWRVTRLDLVTHQAKDLGVLSLEHFASRFDGIGWSVISKNRVLVLDCARSVQDVMWHVSDLPGKVAAFVRGPNSESFVVMSPTGSEYWRYQLPGRRLISREGLKAPENADASMLLSPTGQQVHILLGTGKAGWQISCTLGTSTFTLDLGLNAELTGVHFQTSDTVLTVGVAHDRQITWYLINLQKRSLIARLEWLNAKSAAVVQSPDHWLFFDTDGRLLRVETSTAEIQSLVLR